MIDITRRLLSPLSAFVLRALVLGLLLVLVACTPGGAPGGGGDATDDGAGGASSPRPTVESTEAPGDSTDQPGSDDYDY